MTKKHFNALADMVALLFFIEGKGKPITAEDIEAHLKAILQADNENFDTIKWKCYIVFKLNNLIQNEKARKDKADRWRDGLKD